MFEQAVEAWKNFIENEKNGNTGGNTILARYAYFKGSAKSPIWN